MLLIHVVHTSDEVASSPARLAKVAALGELLVRLSPGEARVVVAWLSGELTQRQIGVGWAALRDLPAAAAQPSLDVDGVEATFTEIGQTSGPGSQAGRRRLVSGLFTAATASEQQFLQRLLGGELRQGAQAGVMTDAVARAAGVPVAAVRRAAMLSGDLPEVAAAVLAHGVEALAGFCLQVGTPVGPMLAQTATDVGAALARVGSRAAVEWKLDGARLQVHRAGDEVRLFTRSLDDVTARLPEIVAAVRALPVTSLVADGEAIALRADGRPEPFQVTASRFGTRTPSDVPLQLFLFDLLHLDGADLLDRPTSDRLDALAGILPSAMGIGRVLTDSSEEAGQFLGAALAAGHEGVVVKSLDAPYEAGRRGVGWQKVKPVHTLDLVVLAVERGSGRRSAWLSNIHLGARDPAGGFVMLGKTFKGMTDDMLRWQTERFTELADGPTDGWVVRVRPVQVVEIAFDGVQRSSRYPGGVTLRFARVLRYRDDKPAAEADTIDAVRAFLQSN